MKGGSASTVDVEVDDVGGAFGVVPAVVGAVVDDADDDGADGDEAAATDGASDDICGVAGATRALAAGTPAEAATDPEEPFDRSAVLPPGSQAARAITAVSAPASAVMSRRRIRQG